MYKITEQPDQLEFTSKAWKNYIWRAQRGERQPWRATAPWFLNNTHFCCIRENKNTKETYTDGQRVVLFTRRGALPEEASIHIAEMTVVKIALKEIHKREDKIWIIYTDTQSPMQSIEYNKKSTITKHDI